MSPRQGQGRPWNELLLKVREQSKEAPSVPGLHSLFEATATLRPQSRPWGRSEDPFARLLGGQLAAVSLGTGHQPSHWKCSGQSQRPGQQDVRAQGRPHGPGPAPPLRPRLLVPRSGPARGPRRDRAAPLVSTTSRTATPPICTAHRLRARGTPCLTCPHVEGPPAPGKPAGGGPCSNGSSSLLFPSRTHSNFDLWCEGTSIDATIGTPGKVATSHLSSALHVCAHAVLCGVFLSSLGGGTPGTQNNVVLCPIPPRESGELC